MQIWSAEIKEIERLYESIKGQAPDLEKELERLIKTDDENIVLVYARRCLEVIIIDLCECELKRPRKTEPLQGIIDKLNREEKIPPHIYASMQSLNSLSTFGSHPKDFDPEQVKPVLNNLSTIIKWYLKYKNTQIVSNLKSEESDHERKELIDTDEGKHKSKKRLIFLLSGIAFAVAVVVIALFVFNIIGDTKQTGEVEKSIAVLPFKSLSDDPEKQYLADGMMDAILLHLSKIEDLRVMSRTSVEQYRDKDRTSTVIGRELDVEYILEGSFQKYGDNARLIVQLIKTGKEGHVWANEYDRNWNDIFSVQSEVAQAIAEELHAVITPEEKQLINKVPTNDLTAYDLHMQALDFYNKYIFSHDRKYLEKVTQLGYISLELDPEFALAYYWLGASSLSDKILSSYFKPFYLDTALFFFNKALELDPTLAEAYSARGFYYYEKDQKQKAMDDLEKAISLSPNNLMGYFGLGLIYSESNDYINALINLKKAEKLERAGSDLVFIYARLYMIYISAGDLQKAELYCNKVQQLNLHLPVLELWLLEIQGKWEELLTAAEKYLAFQPEDGSLYGRKASALLGLGRISEAEDCIRKSVKYNGTSINGAQRVGFILWMNGKKEEAMEYFNRQISFCIESIRQKDPYGSTNAAYDLAGVYAFLGNKEEAYKWLREYEKLGFREGIHEYIKVDPLFDNLRNDEEFKEIVKRANDKAAEIRAKIKEIEENGAL
jgi:TolB-like protein/Flp pilus assembly protein TadD